MHESGMIRGLVEKMESFVEEDQKIKSVNIWLGALSQISASHFREHFELETPGTIAEGVELFVEKSEDVYSPEAQHIILKSLEVYES